MIGPGYPLGRKASGNQHHWHADAGLSARPGEHHVLAPDIAGTKGSGLPKGVRGREWGSALHPSISPILRRGDMLHLDAVAKSHVTPLLENSHDLVAVPRANLSPVDSRVEVRGREEHVVDLLAIGSQTRIRARRIGLHD